MRIPLRASIVVLLIAMSIGCRTERKAVTDKSYPRMVGDIKPDSLLDDPEFKTCNGDDRIIQYFNTMKGFGYKGEKSALIAKIVESYSPVEDIKDQNGYVRIRFVVNCKGQAGRFRILSSNFQYQKKEFDDAIVNQLSSIVKKLDGWETISRNSEPLDYYLYIIFKIEKGHITEILP